MRLSTGARRQQVLRTHVDDALELMKMRFRCPFKKVDSGFKSDCQHDKRDADDDFHVSVQIRPLHRRDAGVFAHCCPKEGRRGGRGLAASSGGQLWYAATIHVPYMYGAWEVREDY